MWQPVYAELFGIQEWDMERLTLDGLLKINREIVERRKEAEQAKRGRQ